MSPQLPAAPCKPFLLANRVHVDGRVYLHVAAESSTATPGIQPSRQHLFPPSKPSTCNTAHSFYPLFLLSQERTQCPKKPTSLTLSPPGKGLAVAAGLVW
ncbi:hypothetical protein TRIATDRAFT_301996 [Trichoderma atroviride IMI 206040]|uniref:Uncharacterized protein n=1 Tax=Hypocrea atroviridis (strain ATCC 20476 / IMI 206040) TaxID=452589 RepID=G9P699_HYPAI|nr:uncharacterized protein TRIATDRAFT_301996 [Trichoderma atroviride IMI 206040]EHK41430.1 hypothetical protein TRIATDRAFT_301996 [Trichoderma atroviride IMI 206040]